MIIFCVGRSFGGNYRDIHQPQSIYFEGDDFHLFLVNYIYLLFKEIFAFLVIYKIEHKSLIFNVKKALHRYQEH